MSKASQGIVPYTWYVYSIFSVFYLHRDDFRNIPPLDAKKLEVFRTVREITGVLMCVTVDRFLY